MPPNITSAPPLLVLKQRLKTFLFRPHTLQAGNVHFDYKSINLFHYRLSDSVHGVPDYFFVMYYVRFAVLLVNLCFVM